MAIQAAPRAALVSIASGPGAPNSAHQVARAFVAEARSLINTRAGTALAVAGVVGAGIFAGGQAAFPLVSTDLGGLAAMAMWPGGLAAMVMSVLLISNEYSARTLSSTLMLQPRRWVVLVAKLLVVTALALVVSLLAVLAGALTVLVMPRFTGGMLPWSIDLGRLAAATAVTLLTCLAALAWGLLARNAPAPIVLLLVWPTLATLVRGVSPQVGELLTYVSLEAPYGIADSGHEAWAKVITAVLAWIVLPGVIGVRHWLHSDLS